MAENNPPSAGGGTQDASRGMPYYEKLRRDLRDTLQKKRILDQNIASLDDNIFKLESSYLEETSAGNIIKGFDNYMKSATTAGSMGTGGGTATRRKGGITDADRIFSKSSASASMKEASEQSSAQSTPSHALTPASSFPQSGRESNHPTPGSTTAVKSAPANKKKKAADGEPADAKPAKRTKITYGRD